MFELLQRLGKAVLPRKSKNHQCLCCGRCCESFGGHLHASKADLERWRALGREDLLRRVNRLGWIWVDPETGKIGDCPFLVRTGPEAAHCGIHEIKPDICRAYPTLAHGRRCIRGVFLSLALAFSPGNFGEPPPVTEVMRSATGTSFAIGLPESDTPGQAPPRRSDPGSTSNSRTACLRGRRRPRQRTTLRRV